MVKLDARLEHEFLERMLEVARHLSASARLTEILSVIINAMRDVLDAERVTVLEYDAAADELFSTVAHGLGEMRMPASVGLAGACARQRSIINVPDAYADRRFNRNIDKMTGFRTRSILTIPLLAEDGELIGVAQVLNKSRGEFDDRDEQIAEALASLAAVAMKRGRLIEDRLVREKLERDLEVARGIQVSTHPRHLPRLAGFEAAAWCEPAEATGGDTYDVIPYRASADHPRASTRHALLVLADATGHGIGPALSVTALQAMLRMAVRGSTGGRAELKRMVRHVNDQLGDDLPGGRFITAWLGEIDAPRGRLLSFSAGQAPLLWYRAAAGTFRTLDADTPPFGVMRDIDVAPSVIEMGPGDLFAVMSDGVFEAMDDRDNQFGLDRARDVIAAGSADPPGRILETLRAALAVFTGSRPADDDRTALIIKRTGR